MPGLNLWKYFKCTHLNVYIRLSQTSWRKFYRKQLFVTFPAHQYLAQEYSGHRHLINLLYILLVIIVDLQQPTLTFKSYSTNKHKPKGIFRIGYIKLYKDIYHTIFTLWCLLYLISLTLLLWLWIGFVSCITSGQTAVKSPIVTASQSQHLHRLSLHRRLLLKHLVSHYQSSPCVYYHNAAVVQL